MRSWSRCTRIDSI